MSKKPEPLPEKNKLDLINTGVPKEIVEKLCLPNITQKDFLRSLSKGAEHWNINHLYESLQIDLNNILIRNPDKNVPLGSFRGFKFHNINFSGSIFQEQCNFQSTTFTKKANFSNCLFRQGADFSEAFFNEQVTFNGAQFKVANIFSNVIFNKSASFSECEFSEIAAFDNTAFLSIANFYGTNLTFGVNFIGTQFHRPVDFRRARFGRQADFSASHFYSTQSFKQSIWMCLPDFADAKFQKSPTLESLGQIEKLLEKEKTNKEESSKYGKIFPIWISDTQSPDKLRHFVRFAHEHGDYHRQEFYFTYEMKAHRYHRVKSKLLKFLYFSYERCSSYGYSILKPSMCLLITALICNLFNTYVLKPHHSPFLIDFINHLPFTFSNLMPFLGVSYNARLTHKFPEVKDHEWILSALNDFAYLINFLGGVFSVIFIFLIGLALRNRFRL